MKTDIENLFKDKVLGHPAGLFVLFFTEMWERFSFYGMRVLLINFLTMAAIGYNPGWEWSVENAGALYGTYAMLLYITPILGGIIADKYTGYRIAVVIGAVIMTLGHVSMAFETELSMYVGLGLLVIGTGFFKPTMSSIISEMYKDSPGKKDGAYTIFYMGVNSGAFFGMMLCGYLAEKLGWVYGFGLAGVFMLLGTLQFWLSKDLFGDIGSKPVVEVSDKATNNVIANDGDEEPINPFTLLDKILIALSAIIGLGYAFNDPISKIAGYDMFSSFKIGDLAGQYVVVLVGLALFFYLAISRIFRYTKTVRDRMIAFIIFAFFTIFFWMSFEQGASSLVIFARDNVNRVLTGNSALLFNIVNTLLTVIPLAIITYVLILLWKKTYKKIPGSNIVLVICFLCVWAVVGWMLNRDWSSTAYDISYSQVKTTINASSYSADKKVSKIFEDKILAGGKFNYVHLDGSKHNVAVDSIIVKEIIVNPNFVSGQKDSLIVKNRVLLREKSTLDNKEAKASENKAFNVVFLAAVKGIKNTEDAIVYHKYEKNKKEVTTAVQLSELHFLTPVTENWSLSKNHKIIESKVAVTEPIDFQKGDDLHIITKDNKGETYGILTAESLKVARDRGTELNRDNGVVKARVAEVKSNEVEVTTSWFSILNSFFIIAFASVFSKLWDSKYNPSAAGKYALGLIIMGLGFGLLAFGAYGIQEGVKVSMIWLIFAYLFHTLGELCLSPVGLSYVSKLVPARMIGFMFGVWYLAIAVGNKLAAVAGGQIENITKQYDLSTFFMIFTIVPIIAGVFIYFLNPLLKKLMHGVK